MFQEKIKAEDIEDSNYDIQLIELEDKFGLPAWAYLNKEWVSYQLQRRKLIELVTKYDKLDRYDKDVISKL